MGSKPRVLVFCCSWCFPSAANLAVTSRAKTRTIPTMCSGKVDPSFILKAFSSGIDGVMLAACPPGDCHYLGGNYQAMRRIMLLQNTLKQLGIEPERLRLERIAPSDGAGLQSAVNEFADSVAKIGPLL